MRRLRSGLCRELLRHREPARHRAREVHHGEVPGVRGRLLHHGTLVEDAEREDRDIDVAREGARAVEGVRDDGLVRLDLLGTVTWKTGAIFVVLLSLCSRHPTRVY